MCNKGGDIIKKFISIGMSVILIVLVFCGCTDNNKELIAKYKVKIENSEITYPLYERLSDEEKELYLQMCARIENHSEDDIKLGAFKTKEEGEAAIKRVHEILVELAYEQPQYFWVNTNTCLTNNVKIFGEYYATVKMVYIMDQDERAEKQVVFDKRVNEILDAANSKEQLFDKVLYIYDEIMADTVYDHEVLELEKPPALKLNAYGCLVGGSTVCSGYSMAFNFLMQKLGLESGVEFNSYDIYLEFEDRHVWNYCKLDGDYYYFDLTWDDTLFEDEMYDPYIEYSHLYFAISKDELLKSNDTILNDVPTPYCDGTKYNYYIYKNQNVSKYSFDAVKPIILEQSNNKYIELRFDDAEQTLKAEDELMTKGYIYIILKNKKDIRYVISDSGLHMYIFFD